MGGSPTAIGGNGPYTYSWTPTTGVSSPTKGQTQASPNQTTVYTVLVTDQAGCQGTDSLTVSIGGPAPASYSVASEQKISNTFGSLPITLAKFDLFGSSVAPVGDLNGDGNEDIIVGAPKSDAGGKDKGAAHILFLTATGTVSSATTISGAAGSLDPSFETLSRKDFFGADVGNLGDVDGDGVTDVIIGAPGDDQVRKEAGAFYIVMLTTDGLVKDYQKVTQHVGGFTPILDKKDGCGAAVDGVGDFDGDGIPDALVGSPFDDDGQKDAGGAYIVYLNNDGTVKGNDKISNNTTFSIFQTGKKDNNGSSVALIDDLDGNGIQDIIMGAVGDDDGGSNKGAAYVLFMDTVGGASVIAAQKISDLEGGFSCVLRKKDLMGMGGATLADFDNDGNADIVVGVPRRDGDNRDEGFAYVFFLDSDGNVTSSTTIGSLTGGFSSTINKRDLFATGIANIGDLDNDGFDDLAIGAPEVDDGSKNSGGIWILFSDNSPADPAKFGDVLSENIDDLEDGESEFSNEIKMTLENDIQVSIYPNPNTGVFKVSIRGLENEALDLSVYNNISQQIFHSEYPQLSGQFDETIDISNFPTGLYMVSLKVGNQDAVRKVLVID